VGALAEQGLDGVVARQPDHGLELVGALAEALGPGQVGVAEQLLAQRLPGAGQQLRPGAVGRLLLGPALFLLAPPDRLAGLVLQRLQRRRQRGRVRVVPEFLRRLGVG
jgi:hypothetical protein